MIKTKKVKDNNETYILPKIYLIQQCDILM